MNQQETATRAPVDLTLHIEFSSTLSFVARCCAREAGSLNWGKKECCPEPTCDGGSFAYPKLAKRIAKSKIGPASVVGCLILGGLGSLGTSKPSVQRLPCGNSTMDTSVTRREVDSENHATTSRAAHLAGIASTSSPQLPYRSVKVSARTRASCLS